MAAIEENATNGAYKEVQQQAVTYIKLPTFFQTLPRDMGIR
jgi:hypothetical protein